MGRRKIVIAPIRDDRNRQVTFVKRKTGLYKKAYELSTLCGCEVGLVLYTSAGKLFEYCSTGNLDALLLKYASYTRPHEVKSNTDIADANCFKSACTPRRTNRAPIEDYESNDESNDEFESPLTSNLNNNYESPRFYVPGQSTFAPAFESPQYSTCPSSAQPLQSSQISHQSSLIYTCNNTIANQEGGQAKMRTGQEQTCDMLPSGSANVANNLPSPVPTPPATHAHSNGATCTHAQIGDKRPFEDEQGVSKSTDTLCNDKYESLAPPPPATKRRPNFTRKQPFCLKLQIPVSNQPSQSLPPTLLLEPDPKNANSAGPRASPRSATSPQIFHSLFGTTLPLPANPLLIKTMGYGETNANSSNSNHRKSSSSLSGIGSFAMPGDIDISPSSSFPLLTPLERIVRGTIPTERNNSTGSSTGMLPSPAALIGRGSFIPHVGANDTSLDFLDSTLCNNTRAPPFYSRPSSTTRPMGLRQSS